MVLIHGPTIKGFLKMFHFCLYILGIFYILYSGKAHGYKNHVKTIKLLSVVVVAPQ
jgi:hypothetical protein